MICTFLTSGPTTTSKRVSKIFHEPFIKTGYRLPSQSWWYYACSLFRFHNETGNVWSHLFAFFVYLYTTVHYGYTVHYWKHRSTWGILGFGIACMIYALLSTIAHLFHSRSTQAHYTFFQIDYIGIGMYGQGMCVMLYTCSGTPAFYSTVYPYYLPINCLMAIFVCISCSSAKMFFDEPNPYRRKALQMSACLGHILFLLVPMYFRVYECVVGGPHCHAEAFSHHYYYAVWFIISALLFIAHVPERFFPGSFDLVGHGHQLFHVAITYTTVQQFRAGYEDWLEQEPELREWMDDHVSFMPIFGCILLTIVVDGVFIYLARNRVKYICEMDRRAEQAASVRNGDVNSNGSEVTACKLANGTAHSNGTAAHGTAYSRTAVHNGTSGIEATKHHQTHQPTSSCDVYNSTTSCDTVTTTTTGTASHTSGGASTMHHHRYHNTRQRSHKNAP